MTTQSDAETKTAAERVSDYESRSERQRFLNWVADRLVNVYGESPNVDFVLRLREEAARASIQEA